MFPLIPLPIKEAISAKVTPIKNHPKFPLIPLPIKEAIPWVFGLPSYYVYEFPLIPLPIKEAIQSCNV